MSSRQPSENLSNVLGSIGASSDSPSASNAPSNSESDSQSASTSATDSPSASENNDAPSSTSPAASNAITDAPDLTSGVTSENPSSLAGAPSLTSGSSIPGLITGAPTLSGFYSYPPPTVPPTGKAPYMQRTDLPENFVFIVVGAVIAFFALVIILWRVLTSWSINRRFQRHDGSGSTMIASSKASYIPLSDTKTKSSKVQAPREGAHDMKDLVGLPRNFSSVPSLFFSPTAQVARHSGAAGGGGVRPLSSRAVDGRGHLPAGHYRDASHG